MLVDVRHIFVVLVYVYIYILYYIYLHSNWYYFAQMSTKQNSWLFFVVEGVIYLSHISTIRIGNE